MEDRGFAALWVAVVLLFLIGSAALAADASEFWEDARFQQNVADLTCLAGVRHLPEDPTTARQKAVDFARANWPLLQTLFPVTSGNTVTFADGEGNAVVITAPFGEAEKMKVEVTQQPDARFGRVLGADQVTVVQNAYCKVLSPRNYDLPFGVLPGPFNGILQRDEPCGEDMGNCHAIRIPRNDAGGDEGKEFMMNIADGLQKILEEFDGTVRHCNDVDPCNVVQTKTGVAAGQLTKGMASEFNLPPWQEGRLRGPLFEDTFTWMGYVENNDSFDDVVWYDGSGQQWLRCSSPRLARVPIVERLGEGPGEGWPPGDSIDMKILGFYWVVIDDPNSPSDFRGANLKRVTATQFDLQEGALCAGSGGVELGEFDPDFPKVSRLVDG
ncbi:MAG: Tad domain-containing protein [Acidimicrobiia bacterium]